MDFFPHRPLVEYTLAVINASLAAMNMNIAAEALGVASVMLSETGRSGFLDAQYLKEKLSLPDGCFPSDDNRVGLSEIRLSCDASEVANGSNLLHRKI